MQNNVRFQECGEVYHYWVLHHINFGNFSVLHLFFVIYAVLVVQGQHVEFCT